MASSGCSSFVIILAVFTVTTNIICIHFTDADVMCSRPIPGVAKMVRGVDITTLDLLPLDFVGDRGIKSPVVNFTCNRNRPWTSVSGQSYQLPDQVWQLTSSPGGWMSANSKLLKTSNDIRTSMNGNVGLSGTFSKFSFSGSHSYKKMQHTITNTSSFVEDVSAFESSRRVDFEPNFILTMDRYAQMFVDRFLTGTYESNKAAYERFIRQFGTHYFSNANFGGFIRTFQQTTKNYVLARSEREIKNEAKASFLSVISAHGGTVHGSTTVSESFRRATSIETKYYGGDVNLLLSTGIQQWQPSVDQDPWLFSGQLLPISDLITDSTKRTNMVTAVAQYTMRGYLDELTRLVDAARNKISNIGGVLSSLESRINVLKAKDSLTESEVDALGRDVDYHLTVPAWFVKNTEICYRWWPDGDGGQCGGGAARNLCSRPNGRTPVYRDDTDGRGGGCRMQWSIKSLNFPSWFSSVRVCYRWYPDGDGGQCGGGAARLLCAPLNNYTPQYRDDTDGRGGGCRMSWKLEVPGSAPLWMKTVSLCYHWYPDGDGGQCGPAPGRTLCASNNGWTAYYRDDTDGRGGGCRMSWGLNINL